MSAASFAITGGIVAEKSSDCSRAGRHLRETDARVWHAGPKQCARDRGQRRPFAFGCSTAISPLEELESLSDYVNWMEALTPGAIQPVTPEQEHFLRVDREQAEPTTVCGRAWVRLKGRREYEREEIIAPSPAPPKDDGMVAFDADRCWW
jgi:uncharacterized protein YifE (UPF0438 family)